MMLKAQEESLKLSQQQQPPPQEMQPTPPPQTQPSAPEQPVDIETQDPRSMSRYEELQSKLASKKITKKELKEL